MKYFFSLLFFSLLLTSCGDADNEMVEEDTYDAADVEQLVEEEATPANMAPAFIDVLNAHGGLDLWNEQAGYSFLAKDFPTGEANRTMTDFHRVNLVTRQHAIEGEDYNVVYDGDKTWAAPSLDKTGFPPNMYQAASFYLSAMPFVFADPGITITDAGMAEFGEEELHQFNVQIPDEMGDGGNDYQVYVDPQTNVLRYATWDLMYPTMADANLRQMVAFNEFQNVSGLNMPYVITLYTAEGDIQPGTPGAQITFERAVLSENPFDEAVFAKPEAAIEDTSAEF